MHPLSRSDFRSQKGEEKRNKKSEKRFGEIKKISTFAAPKTEATRKREAEGKGKIEKTKKRMLGIVFEEDKKKFFEEIGKQQQRCTGHSVNS